MKAITLTLKPRDRIIIPFAHFEMLQGLFYKILGRDNEFSTYLHDRSVDDRASFKLFCFSDLMGRYEIMDKQLIYSNAVKWEIRAVEDEIIDRLVQIIFKERVFELNHCPFEIIDIKFDGRILEESAIVYAATPIVVTKTNDGYRNYFSPYEDEFYEGIANNLFKKYKYFYGTEYDGELMINALEEYEVKKCVTRFKGNYVTGWHAGFELVADFRMLNLAYYSGLGANNSIGFGFIKQEG